MESFNRFNNLFLDVWNNGVFGINASDIIVSLIIFLLFYLLRRLIARFILNRLSRIVSRTANQIDKSGNKRPSFKSRFPINLKKGLRV